MPNLPEQRREGKRTSLRLFISFSEVRFIALATCSIRSSLLAFTKTKIIIIILNKNRRKAF